MLVPGQRYQIRLLGPHGDKWSRVTALFTPRKLWFILAEELSLQVNRGGYSLEISQVTKPKEDDGKDWIIRGNVVVETPTPQSEPLVSPQRFKGECNLETCEGWIEYNPA